VLTRLVEVLLVEALRATSSGDDAPPGLLRGLADARRAPAIRQMHAHVAQPWTVAQLAKPAGLSRSAFFERFTRTVGLPPTGSSSCRGKRPPTRAMAMMGTRGWSEPHRYGFLVNA